MKPKHGKTGIGMRNYIKIDGNLNPAMFMNNLANKVNKEFKDNCIINECKEALKFSITFENELEDEEEIPQELEEEFAKLGIEGYCPNAELAADNVISLPVHPSLTQEDLDLVIEAVRTASNELD